MQLDSIIGLGVFLVFVAWSFTFYSGAFTETGEPLKEMAGRMHDDILDYLEIDVYSIPLYFNSPSQASNLVLYNPIVWPHGDYINSTKVKENGTAIGCEISSNHIYWQTNVEAGKNYHILEFANTSTAMNCTASLNKSVVNHTMAMSEERKKLVSQSRIEAMVGLAYADFQGILGTNRDFNIMIVNSTGTITYGKAIPRNRDVYVPESSNMIWESDEKVNITIAVW